MSILSRDAAIKAGYEISRVAGRILQEEIDRIGTPVLTPKEQFIADKASHDKHREYLISRYEQGVR